MAVNFTQAKSPLFAHRKQKYLMAILAVVLIAILFVAWRGFGVRPPREVGSRVTAPSGFKKAEIDWKMLEDTRLGDLQIFEKITPFEEEIGRENPFMPY